ncbi:MAG TPA: acyl-CoA dehydrogenase family protein [Marmoricola sp.]|nr:acyl-CoA dehydrogenase family protein [Marmoricola sp.]
MHFALSEEQAELAATVRSLLDRHADSTAVRTAMSAPDGFDPSLWRLLCEQVGVAALPVPEEHDGVGASLLESAVVLEEVGRSLAPSPLLAHAIAVAAVLLHGSADQQATLLPRLAAGEIGTVVWDAPASRLVLDGAAAEVLLGFTDGRLVEHDLRLTRVPAMDPTLLLARADSHVTGDSPGDSPGDLRDVAMTLATAVMVGVMQRGLDMTVAYSKEREQFGRPIGSFQALKHRMADLLVLVEASRTASWAASAAAAAYVLEPSAAHRATLHERAAVAQAWCSEAVVRVAGETVQLHGGVAITWEHDAQLVLKRAQALAQLFGRAHHHRATVLGLRGAPSPEDAATVDSSGGRAGTPGQ